MGTYVVVLPATSGLKLPPQIHHYAPQLLFEYPLLRIPHLHNVFGVLDFSKDFVGNRHIQQSTSGYLIPNPLMNKRDSTDVPGVEIRSYDGLVSEVFAQTPHLHRPLDSVTIADPVGPIDHQFGQV